MMKMCVTNDRSRPTCGQRTPPGARVTVAERRLSNGHLHEGLDVAQAGPDAVAEWSGGCGQTALTAPVWSMSSTPRSGSVANLCTAAWRSLGLDPADPRAHTHTRMRR